MFLARIKQHLTYAAIALIGLCLMIGDGTLAILALAAAIGLLPALHAPDVEEIARAVRERTDDPDAPP